MKIYISFGQVHTHKINNTTFDCDCLAAITCDNHEKGRQKAFEYFGDQFFTSYDADKIKDPEFMSWFPRGILEVN